MNRFRKKDLFPKSNTKNLGNFVKLAMIALSETGNEGFICLVTRNFVRRSYISPFTKRFNWFCGSRKFSDMQGGENSSTVENKFYRFESSKTLNIKHLQRFFLFFDKFVPLHRFDRYKWLGKWYESRVQKNQNFPKGYIWLTLKEQKPLLIVKLLKNWKLILKFSILQCL